MERLHSLKLATLLVILGSEWALAADYCSLVVRVVSPDGARPEALVSVREKAGRILERDPTSDDVKFCDLGIEPVTVIVGGRDTCNQVTVANVPLEWRETYVLTVTYNVDGCAKDLPHLAIPSCEVLFRVADNAGGGLPDASLEFQRQHSSLKTDAAGRALLVMKSGTRVDGVVTAAGYRAKNLSVMCSPSSPKIEELVKLDKAVLR